MNKFVELQLNVKRCYKRLTFLAGGCEVSASQLSKDIREPVRLAYSSWIKAKAELDAYLDKPFTKES